jgi:uncharacterized membrane protein
VVIVLSLLAAVSYGISDFSGGLASRRASAITVLLYSYPVGAALMTLLLPFFSGHLSVRTAVFGVAGGFAGLIGVLILYSLMAVAPMNIISPVSAVLAAAVPVLFGVLIGERPSVAAWLGIVLGLIAVVLVTRTPDDHPHGRVSTPVLGLAVLSGVGFGLYFVLLARAGDNSGLWPLVVSRWTSAVAIVAIARQRGAIVRIERGIVPLILVVGVLDALANLFFLLASRDGLLSLASVITSLYPATTVLLAVLVLRERTGWVQRSGLGLAAVAIVLITR